MWIPLWHLNQCTKSKNFVEVSEFLRTYLSRWNYPPLFRENSCNLILSPVISGQLFVFHKSENCCWLLNWMDTKTSLSEPEFHGPFPGFTGRSEVSVLVSRVSISIPVYFKVMIAISQPSQYFTDQSRISLFKFRVSWTRFYGLVQIFTIRLKR